MLNLLNPNLFQSRAFESVSLWFTSYYNSPFNHDTVPTPLSTHLHSRAPAPVWLRQQFDCWACKPYWADLGVPGGEVTSNPRSKTLQINASCFQFFWLHNLPSEWSREVIQNIITFFLCLTEWNSVSILCTGQSSTDMCTRGSLQSPHIHFTVTSVFWNGAVRDSGGVYWCTKNIKRSIYNIIDWPFSLTEFIKTINIH